MRAGCELRFKIDLTRSELPIAQTLRAARSKNVRRDHSIARFKGLPYSCCSAIGLPNKQHSAKLRQRVAAAAVSRTSSSASLVVCFVGELEGRIASRDDLPHARRPSPAFLRAARGGSRTTHGGARGRSRCCRRTSHRRRRWRSRLLLMATVRSPPWRRLAVGHQPPAPQLSAKAASRISSATRPPSATARASDREQARRGSCATHT